MEIIIIVLVILIVYMMMKNRNIKAKSNNDIQEIKESKKIDYFPYKKKYILTKAEYAFYKILKAKCTEKNILICPKVRLEDFIEVTDNKQYMKYRGYIKSRHIDYLLCDENLKIISAIELDDNSHNTNKQKNTDEFKNKLFETINIELYRIKMSDGMYEKEIDKILTLNQGVQGSNQ